MTEYTGHDLIFATGAPGSKWSRVLALLGLHNEVNNSDVDHFPKYNLEVTFKNGQTLPVGNHSGAYFGPGNGLGEKFDNLENLTKEEFLEEIKKPFDNWDQGLKIVKSHWFSYGNNLNWLKENFPDSKIVLVFNENDSCYKWWHFVGGWDISFPTYTWYKDNIGMYSRIVEENEGIIKFAKENLVPIKFYGLFTDFLTDLGISPSLDFLNDLTEEEINLIIRREDSVIPLAERVNTSTRGAAMGVFRAGGITCLSTEDVDQRIQRCIVASKERHSAMKIDEMLLDRYGEQWIAESNRIQQSVDSASINKAV